MIPTHRPYFDQDEVAALARVLDSRWLGLGALTAEFERQIAAMLGARYVLGVSSGTAALHLTLDALGIGPGDEVIVPSLTFVASVQVIVAVGARPVFCEVRADDLNADMADVWQRVTSQTKAILPVHYGGYPCAMDELLAQARARGIWVVEDAAHAFGSAYQGRPIGTLGDVTCFSFDPIKNITCGDGGAIVTDNADLMQRLAPRRNLGITDDSWSRRVGKRESYAVVTPGYRYHLNNLNAAIGLAQLTRFAQFKARKQAIVNRYDEAFADVAGLTRLTRREHDVFPFSYVVRVRDGRRDALKAHLKARDIETAIQFTPNHLHPAFAPFRAALPVTEQLYKEILTLPLYYELTADDVETVINAVRSFFV